MCGIVGYTGTREAVPIILRALERLEYRGYDSAGVGVLNGSLRVLRKQGRVADLAEWLKDQEVSGQTGIGHTRWATHGEPSDNNAHPHCSGNGKLALVHNGIIENWSQLKSELTKAGHSFSSETDTEVLVHFIEEVQRRCGCPLEDALRRALKRVVGAYVILLIDENQPDTILAARRGSPLIIGMGDGEHFLASDPAALVEYTKQVIVVDDHEVAIVRPDQVILKNLENEVRRPEIEQLDLDLAAIDKAGYSHYMLKEIFEQPNTLRDCMRGRLDAAKERITLGGIENHIDQLKKAERIIIVACGTSWHAGLVAEYMIEDLCRIPVEVEYASEFRYRNPIIRPGEVVIALSQSGETADTLVAIEKAKQDGAIVLGVCNVVGSSIARTSHAGIYMHAGPETAVASTKAFTVQLTIMCMLALRIAYERQTVDHDKFVHLLKEVDALPAKVQAALELSSTVEAVAKKYHNMQCALYLGRGLNFPLALEGALKLKEVCYIPAEAYPAAEMKHGPIALVDETLPVVFIATHDECYEKILSSIQEVKARNGIVIAIADEGDETILGHADDVLSVPAADKLVSPIISAVPLQLLAYHMGILKGNDVDKPRNLAKSVTVE